MPRAGLSRRQLLKLGVTAAGATLVPGVRPEFIPVDQFRATVGLQYDFGSNP